MKKLCLFLLFIFVVFPLHAQNGKLTKSLFDTFLKRAGADVRKVGTEKVVGNVTASTIRANAAKVVTPLVLQDFSVSPVAANVAAGHKAALPEIKPVPTAKVPPSPFFNSYLVASDSISGELLSCGQSSTGIPQDIYARNFYNNNPAIKDFPEDIQRAVLPYVAALIEQNFPGTSNPEWIAQNALYDLPEYIPSYTAAFEPFNEDEAQLNATVSYLEHMLELAYQRNPGLSFEGDFVRTYREVEDIYFNGSLNRIGSGSIRQAMREAHERGLKKDAGFFIIKVGELGEKNLQDVLLLDAPNLQWVSFKLSFDNVRKLMEE